MSIKRIIPCLDIQNGETVKGVRFRELRFAGHPLELALRYEEAGADELLLLNIMARSENPLLFTELVANIASRIKIPLAVGGGIRNEEDAARLLDAGAEKLSINSAALQNPGLIDKIANRFGTRSLILAVDCKQEGKVSRVYREGGKKATGRLTQEWLYEAWQRGAGEILLTSIDHDGTKGGFALDILAEITETLPIPLIASGGAGEIRHFVQLFKKTKASAGLAATVFHYGEISIPELKEVLQKEGIAVNLRKED